MEPIGTGYCEEHGDYQIYGNKYIKSGCPRCGDIMANEMSDHAYLWSDGIYRTTPEPVAYDGKPISILDNKKLYDEIMSHQSRLYNQEELDKAVKDEREVWIKRILDCYTIEELERAIRKRGDK